MATTLSTTPRGRSAMPGPGTFRVQLLAVMAVLSLLLAGLTTVLPAQPAHAAAPVTIGNVVLSSVVAYDGTGHGTADRCGITAANGYGGLTDETANDGVVCHGDEGAWSVAYTVADSPSPTVLDLKFDVSSGSSSTAYGGTYLPPNTLNACANDPGGRYTGTVVTTEETSTQTRSVTCRYTFLPGASYSGEWVFPATFSVQNATGTTTPDITATTDGTSVTVPSDPIQVVSAIRTDFELRYEQRANAIVNGTEYAEWDFQIYLFGSGFPQGYSRAKGLPSASLTSTIGIDTSALPSGSIVSGDFGGNQAVKTLSLDHSALAGNQQMSRIRTLTARVPVSALNPASPVQTWAVHISTVSTSVNNRGNISLLTYPDNYNGQPQPGQAQPWDYDTRYVLGAYTRRGQTGPNNDWVHPSYTYQPPGDFYSKMLFRNYMSGDPSRQPYLNREIYQLTSDPTRDDVGVGEKIWAVATFPYKGAVETVPAGTAVCDAWRNEPDVPGNGVQYWDDTRQPELIYVGKAKGSTAWLTANSAAGGNQQVRFEWANAGWEGDPSTFDQCGTGPADPTITWYASPDQVPGGPDAVRATLVSGITLNDPADLGFDTLRAAPQTAMIIKFPFVAGPAADYIAWPERTPVYDAMSIATPGMTEWSSPATRWFETAGPRLNTGSVLNAHNNPNNLDVFNAGQVTQLVGGNSYVFSSYMSSIRVEGWSNDPALFTQVRWWPRFELSSCAVNVVPRNPPSDGSWRLIQSPDLGPDGLACTDDDGDGWIWEVRWTGTITNLEPGTKTWWQTPYYHYIDYEVPGYAETGRQVTVTTTNQALATGADGTEYQGRRTTVSKTATVVQQPLVGQSKTADTPRERVGARVGWKSTFFNTTASAVTDIEFVDVLPYIGDGRGTTTVLSDVQLAPLSGLDMSWVYVTDADPATVVRDTTDPSNDPSNTTLWTPWADADTLTGQVTAVYVNIPELAAETTHGLHVTADTDGNDDGDVMFNDLGVAYSPDLQLPIPATLPVRTELYLGTSGITLTKYIDGQDANNLPGAQVYDGSTMDVTFEVQNIGTDPLTSVVVTDDVIPTSSISCPATTLDAGASMTCTATWPAPDLGTYHVNNGSVSGVDTVGDTVTDTDPAYATPVEPPTPDISIVTSIDGDDANTPPGVEVYEGAPMAVTYLVTNTGTAPLVDVTVTDDVVTSAITCPSTELDPGESMECTASWPGPVAGVQHTNTGSVTGVFQATTVSDSDPANAWSQGPPPLAQLHGTVYEDVDADGDLTAADAPQAGQTVTLTGGPSDGTWTDETDAAGAYSFVDLQPGTYTVTWSAPDGTVVTQVWTVSDPTGIDPTDAQAGTWSTDPTTLAGGDVVTEVDLGYLVLGPNPLLVHKTVDLATATAGDTLTWTITVENPSVHDRQIAGVSDVLPAGVTYVSSTWSFAAVVVEPGEGVYDNVLDVTFDPSVTVAGSTTVTLGTVVATVDADAPAGGTLVNGASGTDPDGTVLDPDGTCLDPQLPVTGGPAGTVEVTTCAVTDLGTVTLSGTVYTDTDDDGTQDGTETGIAGWDVTLTLPDGTTTVTTTTDAAGYYEFTGLVAGGHVVTITDPATGRLLTQSYTVVDPWGQDTSTTQGATVLATDVTDVDWGLFDPVPVTVEKWGSGGLLPGTTFVLRGPFVPGHGEGAEVELTADTPTDGLHVTPGLVLNTTYELVETRTADGRTLLAEPVGFMLTVDGLTLVSGTSQNVQVDGDDPWTVQVANDPAVQLPRTGGGGVPPALPASALLLLAAGLTWLVRSRSREADMS